MVIGFRKCLLTGIFVTHLRGLNVPKPEHHQQLPSYLPLTLPLFFRQQDGFELRIDPVDEILESACLSIDPFSMPIYTFIDFQHPPKSPTT